MRLAIKRLRGNRRGIAPRPLESPRPHLARFPIVGPCLLGVLLAACISAGLPPAASGALLGPNFVVTREDSGHDFGLAATEDGADFAWREGYEGRDLWTRYLHGGTLGPLEGPLNADPVREGPLVFANEQGTLMVWSERPPGTFSGHTLVAAWKPTGASQFPLERIVLCEEGTCDVSTAGGTVDPSGAIVLWWAETKSSWNGSQWVSADHLKMKVFDPSQPDSEPETVATSEHGSLGEIHSPRILFHQDGEASAMWVTEESWSSYASDLLISSRLGEGEPFGEPVRLIEDRSPSARLRVAVGPAGTVALLDEAGTQTRVPYFFRAAGQQDFTPRRDLTFPSEIGWFDVVTDQSGKFIVAGFTGRGSCEIPHPSFSVLEPEEGRVSEPRWLYPFRKASPPCSDGGRTDFRRPTLVTGWKDRTINFRWIRERSNSSGYGAHVEISAFDDQVGAFRTPYALGFFDQSPYGAKVSVASSDFIYGAHDPGSYIVGFGCAGDRCGPGVALGRPTVRLPNDALDYRCQKGKVFYTYRVWVKNRGTTRGFGVQIRTATRVIGRESRWKRWTKWRQVGSGSIDSGFRGSFNLLLPQPPRRLSYETKVVVRMQGAETQSTVFRVKRIWWIASRMDWCGRP